MSFTAKKEWYHPVLSVLFEDVLQKERFKRNVGQSCFGNGLSFSCKYGDDQHLPMYYNGLLGGTFETLYNRSLRTAQDSLSVSSQLDCLVVLLRMYAGIDRKNRNRRRLEKWWIISWWIWKRSNFTDFWAWSKPSDSKIFIDCSR